jgi:hypothetical protein
MKKNSFPNLKITTQFICFLAFTLLLSSKSYSQTNSEKNSKLTASDLTNISNFKSSPGQNRILLFDQIKHLIISIDANGNTSEATTVDELINILGEPNFKIQQSIFQYNLSISSSACKAIIGLSKEGLVTFCVIKECQ